MIPAYRAKIESQGIPHAELAHIRHPIDLAPLFFSDIPHPPRDNRIANFVPADISPSDVPPAPKRDWRPLNQKQMLAMEHVAFNSNRTVIINGPPGM